MSCALDGCDDLTCPVCSVAIRFEKQIAQQQAYLAERAAKKRDAGLREGAKALNGTKPGKFARKKR